MSMLALILKIAGILISLVSGFTALTPATRKDGRLTKFGKAVVFALITGAALSIASAAIDSYRNDVEKEKQAAEFNKLELGSEAERYTTADARVSFILSVPKSLLQLHDQFHKLEQAFQYAKKHCLQPGSVAKCKDYIVRDVIIEELRFGPKSKLFPSHSADALASKIMKDLGVVILFYNSKFEPSQGLTKNTMGGMRITADELEQSSTLFEYDGSRLRWFVDGKLPPDAFKTAGPLSIVDLLGKGASVSPLLMYRKVCPNLRSLAFPHQSMSDFECKLILTQVLKSVRIEDAEIRFPHRKNILFAFGKTAKDEFGIPYTYIEFPTSLQSFHQNSFAWPTDE